MATHNGKSFSDFTGLSVGANALRFAGQRTAAETNADERTLYVRGDSLKYWNGSSESDITSGGTGPSTWDAMYDLDQSLTIDGTTMSFALTHATNDGVTFTGAGASAGDVIQITNAGSGKDINGTSSTWSITKAGAIDAVSVTGDTMITGDGSAAGTFKSSGNYDVILSTGNATSTILTITDGANGDATFTMNGTGKVEIAGTTETNVGFQLTNGDASIADGSLTIVDDDNANTVAITNNTISTGNLIAITSTSLTTGAGILLTANGLTNGYMFHAVTTASGLGTGGAFLFDDGSARFAVKADGATAITTGVNSTKALEVTGIQTSENLVILTSSGVTADDKASLLINPSGNLASGSNIVRIEPTGTPNAAAIGIEFVGASKVMQAMNIDTDTTGDVAIFNGGGNIANDKGILQLTADGATQSAGGTVLRVVNSGTPNAGSIGIEGVFTSKDMIYLTMAGGSATNSAVFFTSTGAIADNKAVLEVTATGTPAAGGSNVLRVDASGITATNAPVVLEVVGDGKDVTALYTDADATTNSANYMHADGALAADKAVLEIVSDAAAGNADSAVLRVNQNDAAGVANVVQLVQADVDKPFISFETTVGAGNAIQEKAALTPTVTHFAMVEIEGVGTRYIELNTVA